MSKDFYKLEDIIDVAKFQKIQDDIAKATDMAILTVDYKGVPFTGHSQCQLHCSRIREISYYRDLCQKCDSRGGLEAARGHKPYIYICHRGLVDLAVPIVVNGQYVGAMMAGQVQLLESDDSTIGDGASDEEPLEAIVASSHRFNGMGKASVEEVGRDAELRAMADLLPKMSLSKIQAIASMLSHIGRYIVEEAILKARLSEAISGHDFEVAPTLEKPKFQEFSEPLTAKADLIQPALDYMSKHLNEKIYIDHMASLCNLSVSYFSKCFNQSTNMNFATYHNHMRLEKAITMLKTTNESVNGISETLGFDNSGYFIKKFKESQGVTPSVFRQQYQAKRSLEHKQT